MSVQRRAFSTSHFGGGQAAGIRRQNIKIGWRVHAPRRVSDKGQAGQGQGRVRSAESTCRAEGWSPCVANPSGCTRCALIAGTEHPAGTAGSRHSTQQPALHAAAGCSLA